MASVDDLWLVDFGDPCPGEPAFRWPALVVAPSDTFGPGFPFVVVVPLTTTDRGLSLHVEIEALPETGLHETSFVQCELIRSINNNRLMHRLGTIDVGSSQRVSAIVRTLFNY